MDLNQLFGGLSDAEASSRRPKYDNDGNFAARVDNILVKEESFKTKAPMYIIETTCTESDISEVRPGQPRSLTLSRLHYPKDSFEKKQDSKRLRDFLTICVRQKFGAQAEAMLAALQTHGPQINPKTGQPMTPEEKWMALAGQSASGPAFHGSIVHFNVTRVPTGNSKKPGEPGFDPTKMFSAITFRV